jgi:threonine dehydrogenase-like Zn-dependent dehydrogenase
MRPVVLPDGADPLHYSIVQVAAISYRGAWMAQPQPGETAVVIGQGVIGALSAGWLAAAGCRVVVVDRIAERLDRAIANGASAGVNADDTDALERVRALCPPDGADIVVESAGVPATVNFAHQLVRRTPHAFRETITTVVGRWPRLVYQANYLEPVRINPWTYFDGEGLTVLTPMDRNSEDQQRVVGAIAQGTLDPKGYLDRVVPVAGASRHYDGLLNHRDEVFSVVFDWEGVE